MKIVTSETSVQNIFGIIEAKEKVGSWRVVSKEKKNKT